MYINAYHNLDAWYSHSPGTRLLKAELSALGNVLPKMFGYYLATISTLDKSTTLLASSTIHQHIIINPSHSPPHNFHGVQCNLNALPFLPESLDVMVLFHTLEFMKKPQLLLQECYTTLINGGYLVMLAFNPYSLWGITKICHKYSKSPVGPWEGNWHSPKKVKHWLRNCGFSVGDHQTFYFCPTNKNPEKMLFLEWLGPIVWPYAGASYMLIAQKSATAPNLVGQINQFISQPQIPKELAKPISRTTPCNHTQQM